MKFTIYVFTIYDLFLQRSENGVELALDTGIHAESVVFEDETTDNVGVHLCLKLHSTLSLTLHHLAHLLFSLRRGADAIDAVANGDNGIEGIKIYLLRQI